MKLVDWKEMPPMQILDDARHTLTELKKKVKFTVDKCMRKHPALLSSSEFKTCGTPLLSGCKG